MKTVITTDKAPAAIGTYSQAIKAHNMVYISGQIPIDPATGLICAGDFLKRVSQVIANIAAIATEAGGSLTDIVKLNVYLTDMADFDMVNSVMQSQWPQPFPARAAVAVSALPKDVDIEIEAIMILDK